MIEQGQRTLTIAEVVAASLCVGCGACAAVDGSGLTMVLTPEGTYRPVESGEATGQAHPEEVCPFSGAGPNEDELADERFPLARRDPKLGRSLAVRAAHVEEGGYRAAGSSGGMTSWYIAELLRQDVVDAVLHVAPRPVGADGPLFSYAISRSPGEIADRSKSRYFAVEMSDALREVRRVEGRYAVVGVPCFIKAVRSLSRVDPVLNERIVTTAALVCGHLKSTQYADFLGWQLGLTPGSLSTVDFRHKEPGRPANRYAVAATGADGIVATAGTESLRWTDWGIGLFKLPACDYCDDVVGETADVSFGDAWLPAYLSESAGKNLVITRTELAERLVAAGVQRGAVSSETLTAADAVASQAAGYRHRRDGLAIRLAARQEREGWAPKKRVLPDPAALTTPFARRMLQREGIARASHSAFVRARDGGSLAIFYGELAPLVRRYQGSPLRTSALTAYHRTLQHLPPAVPRAVRRLKAAATGKRVR